MGEVYAAEHVHIEKRFAIKLLRPEIVSNVEAVQRFRQEARSASSIGHRNIIAIEDFGQLPDGRIYMCMELLNGAALNDLIQTPITVDRLLNILIQTGHGLAAAHAKGIIHRDMKPENIFVTIGPSNEDIPKLLDFGIAKVAGNDGQNNLTRTGTIFGTPFYMAPEQALGNPVDARTDVYAMGVIMYEVFAGSLPFQGESFMGILTQHITTEPEPVAQRAAKAGRQLPMGVAEIITRCMQKNPAQRYGSMDELVNALIQIYRGIAGPGMSTYMEAFPVVTSGRHAVPTPPPLTGPVHVGAAHAPTQTPHMLPQVPGTGPVPVQVGPSGPHQVVPGASSSSGLYPGYVGVPIKKSNTGLIIAIIAVLVVGGGIAAFAVVSPGKKESGDGSGSMVALAPDAGGGGELPPDAAIAAVADAEVPVTPDAEVVATIDAAVEPPDTGIVIPDTVQVLIKSKYHTSFEVWEDGRKLFDGPDNLPIVVGESRKITIKARGFKDKTFTVPSNARERKFEFRLDRAPGPGPGPGSGSARPPADPGCRHIVADPYNKACIEQYCKFHKNDDRCNLE
jgi:serine/threonine protein kinase